MVYSHCDRVVVSRSGEESPAPCVLHRDPTSLPRRNLKSLGTSAGVDSPQNSAEAAIRFRMRQGRVDLVLPGRDRVLGQIGGLANEIGPDNLAELACRNGIPFHVGVPS